MNTKPEKVKQIIRAAVKEFQGKGVNGASMQDIAELAKVSKRTLYKYYPSKELLYEALLNNTLDLVEKMYAFEFSIDDPIEVQIRNIIETKIKLTLNNSFIDASKVIINELIKGNRPNHNQMKRLYLSENQFVEWVREAQLKNIISSKKSPEEISYQFHAILKGKIYWPILTGGIKKQELNIEEIKIMSENFFIDSFCVSV